MSGPFWVVSLLLFCSRTFIAIGAAEYSSEMTVGCIADSGYCACLHPKEEWRCYNPAKRNISVMIGKGNWYATESNLGQYSCKTTNCLLYEGSGEGDRSHAMIGAFPSKNYPGQLKFDLKFENEGHDLFPGLNPYFESQFSFRRHHDENLWVPLSYVNADMIAFREKGASFESRTGNLSIFINNMYPRSARNEIFGNLSIHYTIQSFGKFTPPNCEEAETEFPARFPRCFNLYRRSAMWDSVKECVYFYSKLALAFENSHARGYLTEKIWQPLKMGAIPVVLGKKYVQPYLPHPHAAIFVDDFSTVEGLAAYLRKVVTEKSLWLRHTAWKDLPTAHWGSKFKRAVLNSYATFACLACETTKRMFYSEFMFEKMIAPIRHCVYDSFVLEYVESHAQPVGVTGGSTDGHGGIDAVYVISYHDDSSKRGVHNAVRSVRSVFSVQPTVVDIFESATVQADLTLRQCFTSPSSNFVFGGDVPDSAVSESSLPTYVTSVSVPVLSEALKHLYAYYHMLEAGFERVLIIDPRVPFLNSTATQWRSLLKQSSSVAAHALLLATEGRTKSSPSPPSPPLEHTPGAYLMTRAGALRIFELLAAPLPTGGIVALLNSLSVSVV